ncbi:MAG: glutamate-5-semialdehyde dehydrogenase [Alphaproteobacteria bacterium]|nr:glutamate-5-semialdehyde dehydrogenase [Alphaproteobacteria bacterium]
MTARALATAAKQVAPLVAQLSTDVKNKALTLAAEMLLTRRDDILTANGKDMAAADNPVAPLAAPLRDRLLLNEKRIVAMAESLSTVAALPDPVGELLAAWDRPNGLHIKKIACPLGVLLAIYESRPNVSIDIAALALKSGNVCLLRPGSESFHSSALLVDVFQQALTAAGVPPMQTQMVKDKSRDLVRDLLTMRDLIDVVVPRGGKGLIDIVTDQATMPVFAHREGNCHVYVSASADKDKAIQIITNAKLRRVEVCGAMESLLMDESVADKLLPLVAAPLLAAGVELRACAGAAKILAAHDMPHVIASEDDFYAEYLDKILSIKLVKDVAAATAHINHYGSHHTDAVVTENKIIGDYFLRHVESAIVLLNASTQFADGGEFGFGAEVGIATGKFHARGPVGLKELCSYYYQVLGNGQCRP